MARLVTPARLARAWYYLRAGDAALIGSRIMALIQRTAQSPARIALYAPADADVPLSLPTSEQPLVSILVPVYNHWLTTRNCLAALRDNTQGIAYEVLIADDASQDETRNIAALAEGVRHVRSEENRGFLGNCNHAAKYARGEYLVLLNNDTVVQPGWLPPLIALLEERSDVGLVGPMLLYPDGRLQEAGGIVWKDGSGWNYGRLCGPLDPEYNYVKEVDYISGACVLARRTLWEAVGGFDRRFAPAYYEDTDLAFAIRASGYKVMYQPLSRVVHVEGVSHGTDPSAGIKAHQARNRETFLRKWSDVLSLDHGRDARDLFRARDRGINRKRVLFIDHHVPMRDRDAGSRSTFQYLGLMAETGYRVSFLGADFAGHQPYTTELQQRGIEMLVGPTIERSWKSWLKTHGKDIDYVYISRPDVAKAFLPHVRRYSRAKLLYCGHDLHFLREERRYALQRNAAYRQAAKRWERLERSILETVDVAYFFSSSEVETVRQRFPGVNAQTTPLYLFDEADMPCREPGHPDERHGLLFVGGFMHPPNADGMRWFLSEVFPIVQRDLPGVPLTVVGGDPPQDVLDLAAGHVRFLGRIPDTELDRCYRSARLFIAPLRFGAGVKGKIVDALRYGLPTVTTPVGAEGIAAHDDGSLLVADSADGFAAHIVDVYADTKVWNALRRNGCTLIENHFSRACAHTVLQRDMPA